jgi:hypothetical protein
MATLVIYLNTDESTGLELQGFPFGAEQYIESEIPNEDMTHVYIPLGDTDDTTVIQEQFLNTNPHVLSYRVVP